MTTDRQTLHLLPTLILEDDPATAKLMLEVLRSGHYAGYSFEPITCGRLADALWLLERRTYAAAVVDLGLPDASGTQAVETIVAAAPSLPIVVVTGNKHYGLQAVNLGAEDYMTKGEPCLWQHLPQRIVFATIRHRRFHVGPAMLEAWKQTADRASALVGMCHA